MKKYQLSFFRFPCSFTFFPIIYWLCFFFKYFLSYWLPFVFLSAMLFLCRIASGAKLRFSSECTVFLKFQVVYKHRIIYYKVESFQFMKFSGENFFLPPSPIWRQFSDPTSCVQCTSEDDTSGNCYSSPPGATTCQNSGQQYCSTLHSVVLDLNGAVSHNIVFRGCSQYNHSDGCWADTTQLTSNVTIGTSVTCSKTCDTAGCNNEGWFLKLIYAHLSCRNHSKIG